MESITDKKPREETEEDFADKMWRWMIGNSLLILKLVAMLFILFFVIVGLLWLSSLMLPYFVEVAKSAARKVFTVF